MSKKSKDAKRETVQDKLQNEQAEELISLEEFLEKVPLNPYLRASFVYCAKHEDKSLGEPKTLEDWKGAVKAQSNRKYD